MVPYHPDTPLPLTDPNPSRAIALKVASVLAFTVMAALIKWASQLTPPGEVVFFRSLFAFVPIGFLLWYRHELSTAFATANLTGHLWRGVVGALGMGCGFTALALLPLPEAIALGYAMPLFATILAALMLGEVVRVYRWSAILLGMLGVIVILWPRLTVLRDGFQTPSETLGALFSLGASLFGAFSIIQTRQLVATERTATVVVYFMAVCSLAGLVTLPFGWTWPPAEVAAALVLSGVFGGIGQLLLTESYRFADTSTIAPFDYTSLLFGIAVGYLVFGDLPTTPMLVGSAIVIGAGLFIIFREHQLGLERARSRKTLTPQG